MSLHRSLKTKPGALNEHRNVLKRAERIERLAEQSRFDPEENSPLSLPKVANRALVKKKKAAKEDDGAATEATEEASTESSPS